jgi:hypothetical protein
MYEYRCDARLNTKTEGSTRLTYAGLNGGLEHIKSQSKDRDEVNRREVSEFNG